MNLYWVIISFLGLILCIYGYNLSKAGIYQILAQKYRPKNFVDLIGHEKLSHILSNSIISGKIAQAFLFSGSRGIGKTTLARIMARTINCDNLQFIDNLAVPCNSCVNCQSYENGNHPDFIELDAASKTGVNDMREVIETMKYLPLMGKYKIYVIDEVHMLSINAFNALLKTLEEPPAHTKIIFATTEIRKIPLTIISRCQKFDLKPITQLVMADYLIKIADKEISQLTKEAAILISEAATGSARDSLSILDICFSYSLSRNQTKNVDLEIVKEVLGINSSELIYQLVEHIIKSETKLALEKYQLIYSNGLDPIKFLEELMEIILIITKIFYNPQLEISPKFNKSLGSYLKSWHKETNIEYLTILWQMISNSLPELKFLSFPHQATEMIIIRLCHVKKLPLPSEIDLFTEESEAEISSSNHHHEVIETVTITHDQKKTEKFIELTNLFKLNKEPILYHHLREDIKLIKYEEDCLEVSVNQYINKNTIQKIQDCLRSWTNNNWIITISDQSSNEPSLKELEEKEKRELVKNLEKNNQIVQNIYETFPGAKIIDIKK